MTKEDKSYSPVAWCQVNEQCDREGRPTLLALAARRFEEQGCNCETAEEDPEDQCMAHVAEGALMELRELANELIDAVVMDTPVNTEHWDHLCLLCGQSKQRRYWMVMNDRSPHWYNPWTRRAPLTPGVLAVGMPVMYHPIRGGRGYLGIVETEPWVLGDGTWVCHVRDLESAYRRDISDRTRVCAVALEALSRVANPAVHG